MSVETFKIFVEKIEPAWKAAWKDNKEMTIAACGWLKFDSVTIEQLRRGDNRQLSYLIDELRTMTSTQMTIFWEVLKFLEVPPKAEESLFLTPNDAKLLIEVMKKREILRQSLQALQKSSFPSDLFTPIQVVMTREIEVLDRKAKILADSDNSEVLPKTEVPPKTEVQPKMDDHGFLGELMKKRALLFTSMQVLQGLCVNHPSSFPHKLFTPVQALITREIEVLDRKTKNLTDDRSIVPFPVTEDEK